MSKSISATEELLNLGNKGVETTEAERNQLYSDVAETFGTKAGRRILRHITRTADDDPMTGNSQTYHNLGKMEWANGVLDLVALADYETYIWVKAQRAHDLRARLDSK